MHDTLSHEIWPHPSNTAPFNMAIFFFAPLVTVLTGFFLKTDTMDKWDQSKLEEVIEKKHGEKEKSMPKTEIVSSLLWHGSN